MLFPDKKIVTIFGCGGNRDISKRTLMGKIAEQNSDITILTSDNPRDENPDNIINDIISGMNECDYREKK